MVDLCGIEFRQSRAGRRDFERVESRDRASRCGGGGNVKPISAARNMNCLFIPAILRAV